MSLITIVLAAGQGTRMKSDLPKVLHTAAGRTLIDWALSAVEAIKPDRVVVVVGHGADLVRATLPPNVEAVLQAEQLGTGHAVAIALESVGPLSGDDTVLVTYGDMPLVTPALLSSVVRSRPDNGAVITTVELDEPTGYGRVVRAGDGGFSHIVEEKDATNDERRIREINAGLYGFPGKNLASLVSRIATNNAQGEHYLPDVLPLLLADGAQVRIVSADALEVLGVNSHDQLSDAEAELRRRINRTWQQAGVWMQDPDRVYIDAGVVLAAGVRLYPGVHLEGATTVGEGAVVGPDCFIRDSEIGAGAHVWYSVLRNAQVGDGAEVGPYASLRPGTVLKARSKAGTFVEIKNSVVGEEAKVPHLSYIGDATIGARSNIGAGSITCNYDGYDKHETVIGEDAFVGSDTMLVAPVTLGDGAVTGAGSVITNDVEPGALAVARSPQRDIPGYAARREERHQATRAKD